ncbi:MAG: hypothetical protein ABI140_14230 [Jatrophihabitantaceae bacterium]
MITTSSVALHPLTMVAEGEDVLIGRMDTDSFAVFPADGAAVVSQLQQGRSPAEVRDWYAASYGEQLDLDDLLQTLDELGFLRRPGEPVAEVGGPVRFQRLGRLAFSPLAWLGYLALAIVLATLLIRHPSYAPHPGQLFFTKSALAVELTVVFGQLPLLFAHEAFHTLAGRRRGLPSRIGVGTRMYILVAETQLNGLLTLPKRHRYLCFLAGLVCDIVLIAILDIAGYLLRSNSAHDHLYSRLAFALSFPIVTRIAYQFVLFLQTDIYFVLATALNCQDVHGASIALVRNRFDRLLGRTDRQLDSTRWSPQELRAARWYSPFLVVGVLVFTGVWIFIIAPVFVQLARLVWDGLQLGAGDPAFWDRACFVSLSLAQLIAAAVIAYRKHNGQRRAAEPRQPHDRLAGISPMLEGDPS